MMMMMMKIMIKMMMMQVLNLNLNLEKVEFKKELAPFALGKTLVKYRANITS